MPYRQYATIISVVWLVVLLLGIVAVAAAGPDPLSVDLGARLMPPGHYFVLGSDELGRSMWARLLYAAASSLQIAFFATGLCIAIGASFGLIAGWYGGWLDAIIDIVIGLFWTVPFAIFAVLLLATVGASVLSVVIVIAAVNWVGSARVIRAETLRLKDMPFVRAARGRGASEYGMLVREILPNLRHTAAILIGLGVAETVALESGLAFLGMGLPPPAPSWGGMISEGIPYLSAGWWISALPAGLIVLTIASMRTLSANLAGSKP